MASIRDIQEIAGDYREIVDPQVEVISEAEVLDHLQLPAVVEPPEPVQVDFSIEQTANLQMMQTNLIQISQYYNDIAIAAEEAAESQEALNASVEEGSSAAKDLGTFIGGVQKIAGFQSVLAMAEEYGEAANQLQKVNDGTRTLGGLQKMVYGAAQRTGVQYNQMAETVTAIGDSPVFQNNQEAVAFTELMNKQMAIGYADDDSRSAAMGAVTDTFQTGTLSEEGFQALSEAAPQAVEALAGYVLPDMGLDQAVIQLQQMAAQGQISADMLKNSMFMAATETNAAFSNVPTTWSNVLATGMNVVTMALQPLMNLLNLVISNWSILQPIVLAVAAALGIMAGALFAVTAAEKIKTVATIAHAVATTVLKGKSLDTSATLEREAAAQWLVNNAMLASPITWIVIGLMLVIAVIYAVVAAINKFTGSSYSATGLIVGAFFALGAAIYNIFIGVINFFITIANFFANVFNNPLGAIKVLFYETFSSVLGIVAKVAEAIETMINLIPGVEVDLTSKINGLKEAFEAKAAQAKEEEDYKEIYESLEYKDLGQSIKNGYLTGENMANQASGFFGGGDIMDGLQVEGMETLEESMANTEANTGAVAGNTGAMSESVGRSSEEMSFLRQMAEREAINRFTTAQIRLEMVNHNDIKSPKDADGLITQLRTGLQGAMSSMAEGV